MHSCDLRAGAANVYWLCIGTSMDVKSRVEEHERSRTAPSRDLSNMGFFGPEQIRLVCKVLEL